MTYKLNGKSIKIPDAEIEKSMKALELSREEAIQMWLEDEGYLENEEQQALDAKAKASRITATIHQASAKDKTVKKTQKERVQKEDTIKEMVIAEIANFLPKFAENIQILNKNKLISFQIGEDLFELDLKRKRKPKK